MRAHSTRTLAQTVGIFCLSLLLSLAVAVAQEQYRVDELGLDPSELGEVESVQHWFPELTDSGKVLGGARVTVDGDVKDYLWVFDGHVTHNITVGDSSFPVGINSAGHVVGYGGHDEGFSDAWLFDGTDVVILAAGNSDSSSYPSGINDSGQVIGHTVSGTGDTAAWFFDHGKMTPLGIDLSARASSWPSEITPTGKVLGFTETPESTYWWLFNGSTTVKLRGLSDGQHDSDLASPQVRMNQHGQVVGVSTRLDGGLSVWIDEGFGARNIGLIDGSELDIDKASHTRFDGFRDSDWSNLNDEGQVIGRSSRFVNLGFGYAGESAWLYDHGVTREIGLIDRYHAGAVFVGLDRLCRKPAVV